MQNRTPSRPDVPDFTPVPRKRARFDGWTAARQKAFIDALANGGSVTAAAAAVNMSTEGAYHLRRQPGAEEFAAAWDAALAHRIDILRDAVMERAIHGTEMPVMSYGKHIGTRRIYNDRLATFMLRNYDGGMSHGVTGAPLHQRRAIDEAVAKAREEWEAEREREREDSSERSADQLENLRQALGDEGLWPANFGISRWELHARILLIARAVFARVDAQKAKGLRSFEDPDEDSAQD